MPNCLRCVILKVGDRQLMGDMLKTSCFHTFAEVWRGLWSHLLIIPQNCNAEVMVFINNRVQCQFLRDERSISSYDLQFPVGPLVFSDCPLWQWTMKQSHQLFHVQLEMDKAGAREWVSTGYDRNWPCDLGQVKSTLWFSFLLIKWGLKFENLKSFFFYPGNWTQGCSTNWATSSAPSVFYGDRVLLTCPGWAWICDPPSSASQVAGIISICHHVPLMWSPLKESKGCFY